jgi:hypothetical protein
MGFIIVNIGFSITYYSTSSPTTTTFSTISTATTNFRAANKANNNIIIIKIKIKISEITQ